MVNSEICALFLCGAASGGIFRTALHNYLDEHAYGNAQTADLWAAMTAAAKEKVAI